MEIKYFVGFTFPLKCYCSSFLSVLTFGFLNLFKGELTSWTWMQTCWTFAFERKSRDLSKRSSPSCRFCMNTCIAHVRRPLVEENRKHKKLAELHHLLYSFFLLDHIFWLCDLREWSFLILFSTIFIFTGKKNYKKKNTRFDICWSQ